MAGRRSAGGSPPIGMGLCRVERWTTTSRSEPGSLGPTYWAVRADAIELTKNLSASAAAIAAFTAVSVRESSKRYALQPSNSQRPPAFTHKSSRTRFGMSRAATTVDSTRGFLTLRPDLVV